MIDYSSSKAKGLSTYCRVLRPGQKGKTVVPVRDAFNRSAQIYQKSRNTSSNVCTLVHILNMWWSGSSIRRQGEATQQVHFADDE